MADLAGEEMPAPETDEIGRYLEDTITIDWQTPLVSEQARSLLEGADSAESRVRVLFEFVRDEIADALEVDTGSEAEADRTHAPAAAARATCRASEVLTERTGLCYAKSHLLAGLLRYAGYPTGFCYARLASETEPERFALRGFNAVHWTPTDRWIYLDAGGGRLGSHAECRFEPPFSLARAPDPGAGESFLPFIYKRPAKRIIDLLERAPDLATVRRNLPDAI